MAQWHNDHTELAMPWIERLMAAEPANPEGLYQKVWALMDGRWVFVDGDLKFNPTADRAGALAALRQAATMSGHRNDHVAERMQTVCEAAIACGVGPGEAERLALDGLLQRSTTSRALAAAREALLQEMADATAAGGEERLMVNIGLGFLTAEKFLESRPLTVKDEVSANSLKECLLQDVPDDAEIGAGGRSVRSLRSDNEAHREYLLEVEHREEEAAALLRTASDETMDTYFHCFMGHGEHSARSWLLPDAEAAKRTAAP
jgi:hypothetical protein